MLVTRAYPVWYYSVTPITPDDRFAGRDERAAKHTELAPVRGTGVSRRGRLGRGEHPGARPCCQTHCKPRPRLLFFNARTMQWRQS